MAGFRGPRLAGGLAVCLAGAAGAQGLDINELLKGGADRARPEATVPAVPPSDLLNRFPGTPEADVGGDIPPAPPIASFPATALIGNWAGAGESCAARTIKFTKSNSGFLGQSTQVDPIDGYRITTRFETSTGKALPGAPHPEDQTRFFSYARQYPARVIRTDGSGTVLGLIKDVPVTLVVSRSGVDLTLRIVEPVTACRFVRPAS